MHSFHTNILIVGLLALGFMSALVAERALTVMTIVPLVAFITQMILLINFSRDIGTDYSDKTLFYTVLIYTFIMGVFFMLVSEYYDGDHFLFNKYDAMFYYKISMQAANAGIIGGVQYLLTFESDDWGSLFFDSLMMYIIPSKLFLNAMYTLLTSISSVYLYRIGKAYMSERFAFLAALGYASSSYIIFFNCSFLKESLFVFVVVSALYYQHRAIMYGNWKSMCASGLFIGLIFFFRPAVAAFLAASIFVYYGIINTGKAISIFLYIAAVGVVLVSMKTMLEVLDSNTAGGDLDAVIDETNNGAYSSSFNYFVSFFGAFFGPFPSIFPKLQGPSYMEYLAAGLIYKLFLVAPFWYGVFVAFKEKFLEMYPLIIFVLLELLLTGAICASLELRKVMPHIPFMYIVSLYGMSKGFQLNRISHISTLPWYVFAVGVMFLWNVIKADNASYHS